MRIILKIFVWPVILLLGVLCFLGTIAYKVAAYVISPFLLLDLGCCIYCLVQARWMDLAIFAVIELGIPFGAVCHDRTGDPCRKFARLDAQPLKLLMGKPGPWRRPPGSRDG